MNPTSHWPAAGRRLGWLAVVWLATVLPSLAAPSMYEPPTQADRRQYAPNREMDILHLLIDVTPDFQKRTVTGKVTLRFKPVAQPLAELKLDGIDLRVSAVTGTEKVAAWQATRDKVLITFAEPVPAGKEASVTVE